MIIRLLSYIFPLGYAIPDKVLRKNDKILINRYDNVRITAFFALLFVATSANMLAGAQHTKALRLENRLSWKASPQWELRSGIQMRLRDRFRDFYYRKFDTGAVFSLNQRVQLPLYVRFEDRDRGEGWFRRTSLLFDPTFLLASPGNWRLDVRTRLQYLADENRLQHIRIQPRLWRSFNWRGLGWWVYNDFYFRLVDTGTGSVTNYSSNNFSTGFKLPLNDAADISLYYMVFSMLPQQNSPRKYIHQACISFGWHFGGNSDSFPAVRN